MLKTWRQAAGLTVEKAAEALKVTAATIYYWEAGTKRPSPEVATRIVTVYGLTSEQRSEFAEWLAFAREPDPEAPAEVA